MAKGNGTHQQPAGVAACAICGAKGFSGQGRLCAEHYDDWTHAKESIRFNEAAERGEQEVARVAFEDFVRRLRAERLHRAA